MSSGFFAKLRQLKVEAPMAAKVGMGQKFANIAYLAMICGWMITIACWTLAYLTEYYYDALVLYLCVATGIRRNGRKHRATTRRKWLNIKYPLRHTSKLETESMRESTSAILASLDHECHGSSCAKVAALRKALRLTCDKLPVYVLIKALSKSIECPCQARSVVYYVTMLLYFAEEALTRHAHKLWDPTRIDPDKELDEAEIGTYIRSNYASAIMAELLARLSLRIKYGRKRGASVKVDTIGQMFVILVDDKMISGLLLRGWLWLNRAMCFNTSGIKMMTSSNIFCDFDTSKKSMCEKYQRKLQKWDIYNRKEAESHVLRRFFNDCNGTDFSYSDMFCTLFERHMKITRARNRGVNLSASMLSAPCFSNTFYDAVDENLMDGYEQLVLYPSASIWTGNVVVRYSDENENIEVVRGGLVTSVRMQSLLLIGLYVGLLAACLGLGIVHSEALSDVNVDPTSLTSLMAVVLALVQQVLMSFWGEDMTWGDFLRGRRVVYRLTHRIIRKTGFTSTEFIRQLMINKSLGQILMAEHRTCFLPYKCSGNSYFAFHVTPRMLACTGAAIYTDTYSALCNGIDGLLVQKVSTEYRSEKRHFRQCGRAALWYNLRTVAVSDVSCPMRLTWHVEDSKRRLPKTKLYVVTFHNISVMGGATVSHNMSESTPTARKSHLRRGECANAPGVNGSEYLMAEMTKGIKKSFL